VSWIEDCKHSLLVKKNVPVLGTFENQNLITIFEFVALWLLYLELFTEHFKSLMSDYGPFLVSFLQVTKSIL